MNRGFTFIEILVVIAIFAALAAVSFPYTQRSYQQYVLTVETKNVISIIRKAQTSAITNANTSAYGVRFGSSAVTLFRGATYATRNSTYDEVYGISTSVTVTGPTEIDFAQWTGRPSTTATVTLTSSGRTQTLALSSEGAVDW